MARGLILSVFRDATGINCTNNGISSKVTEITLVGEGIDEVFTPSPQHPEFRLVIRWKGTPNEYKHLEPVDRPAGMGSPMFGGNYAGCSDSRVKAICPYPMPIHDRFEY